MTALFLFLIFISLFFSVDFYLNKVIYDNSIFENLEQRNLVIDKIYLDTSKSGVFKNTSLLQLFNYSYDQIKEMYGIGYEYYLAVMKNNQVYVLNNTKLETGYQNFSRKHILRTIRKGILNNESVDLILEVYG
ncbi:MAG: hypothetical protein QXK00_03420 [archaeon]